jgi:predicted Zn-dependent peptidase
MYQQITLSNGLRIVYLPSDSTVSYCGLAVRAGTRDEAAGQSGLAHFVEHMLFKGTARRSSKHILNRMETVGGELNAYTTKEETFLYSVCLSDDACRAIELLGDLAFHSQFPAAEIGKEREVVLDEIRSYEDNPAETIFDEFENRLFRDSVLGRPILGTEATLRALTSDACRAFSDAWYRPENMVFFFLGRMPWKKLVRLAERHLSEAKGSNGSVQRARIRPEGVPAVRERVDKGLHQSHVVLGSRGYGLHDEKRIGLYLLNNLLGGPGMNSRLNLSMREERGLVYSVDASVVSYSDVGMFSVYFGCDAESVPACVRLVHKELRRLRDRALTSSQLRAAVKQMKGQMGVSADQRESVALALGKSVLHYNRYEGLPEMFARLDALTPSALLEIANEVFDESLLFELIFE